MSEGNQGVWCKVCGRMVSTGAWECPGCGEPMRARTTPPEKHVPGRPTNFGWWCIGNGLYAGTVAFTLGGLIVTRISDFYRWTMDGPVSGIPTTFTGRLALALSDVMTDKIMPPPPGLPSMVRILLWISAAVFTVALVRLPFVLKRDAQLQQG